MTDDASAWLDRELERCRFADGRLCKRRRTLLTRLSGARGESIPFACQDWTNTKAACRCFANERVGKAEILGGRFQATRGRSAGADGLIMVLHDTSELSCQRRRPEPIGQTCRVNSGKEQAGPLSSAHRLWAPDACQPGGHHRGPATRPGVGEALDTQDIQRHRCLEADDQPDAGAHRAQGEHPLAGQQAPVQGGCSTMRRGASPWVTARATSTSCSAWPRNSARTSWPGVASTASPWTARAGFRASWPSCRSRAGRPSWFTTATAVVVKPWWTCPVTACGSCRRLAGSKRDPALTLTVLHAREPADRPRIDGKLVTDLPVTANPSAIEKLRWYALRWKIELVHKSLTSGCRAEAARLRTALRLVKLIAGMCILSWRVFWMTMLNRSAPNLEPGFVMTRQAMTLLDALLADKLPRVPPGRTLARDLTTIARHGGDLARASDPPPGNIVMWRGMSRLSDITLGASLQAELVGN